MSAPVEVSGPAGIIGAGAFGTALAQALARAGRPVRLWMRDRAQAAALNADRRNPAYLSDIILDDAIEATSDLGALSPCAFLLAVVPAQEMRAALAALGEAVPSQTPIILCAKGIERTTLKLMNEVLAEIRPRARAAVLSGPGFARDIAEGLPTATTLACADAALGAGLVQAIGSPSFRPYLTGDVIGAEVGGAIKNVLAIAAGVVEGRGLGKSAHAALIARGFAEMTRLAVALGGRRETLAGLCGLGDLVLTCTSPQSRNMSLGLALGRGAPAEAALKGAGALVEGAASAPAVVALAARHQAETPICAAVEALLAGRTDVDQAIEALLSRPFTLEGV